MCLSHSTQYTMLKIRKIIGNMIKNVASIFSRVTFLLHCNFRFSLHFIWKWNVINKLFVIYKYTFWLSVKKQTSRFNCTTHFVLLTFGTYLILNNIPAYPTRAANTNNMHDKIQVEIAVKPSTFGEFDETELKIFIKTRNKVTSSVILPGITWGSIRKLACRYIENFI